MRRRNVAIPLVVAAVTAAVLTTGSPAAAAEPVDVPLTTWTYLDSQSPQAKFVDTDVTPPVGTSLDDEGRTHTYRSYFTFDLTNLKGTVAHDSYLGTVEETVTDCAAPVTVEVWRTRPVRDNTTWLRPPAELEKLLTVQRGAPDCQSHLVLDLVPTLNAALSRHEKSITLELRVTEAQESDARTGRTFRKPQVRAMANHPPTITKLALASPDRPCGTLARPSPAAQSTRFAATATDVDPHDYAYVVYAIWPVEHPEQRREFGEDGDTDLSEFADGTLLAWQARAGDHDDVSPWSRTCYLVMDLTGPANAPMVSSRTYPEGDTPGGGTGIEGTFRFDAAGDRDVAGFAWYDSMGRSGEVAANRPGGKAIFKYTPTSLYGELYVASVDLVGNRGPESYYLFRVADTAPDASVTVNGVGLPSTITFAATKPETTAFGYQIKDGEEVRLPAVDGHAAGQITFTATGTSEIAVRSYAGNRLIGQDTLRIWVTDAPGIASAEFNLDIDQIAGKTGSFRFTPRHSDVVAYEYRLGNEWKTIPAADDDTAVLQWTATPGWQQLAVRSVRSDGGRSMQSNHSFLVIDPRPTARALGLNGWPRRDGVGVPLTLDFSSSLPNRTGFAYRFGGGAEQTVSSGGSGYVSVTVTPQHAGANTLVLQALLPDGTRSPAATYTFTIWSGPVVTSSPEGDGTVGRPTTFTFRPGLPDVVSYRYSLPGAAEETIAAGPDGAAAVTYTPVSPGYQEVRVTSVGVDGTESEPRTVQFIVRDSGVSVVSS